MHSSAAMSPLSLFAAGASTAAVLAGRTPSSLSASVVTKSTGAVLHGAAPRSPAVSIHHLFAPGRKSLTRKRQFSITGDLFRSLPLPPDSNPPPGLPSPSPHRNPAVRLNPTYALVVSYDGSAFSGGYEKNPNLTDPTVRGVLSDRISSALGPDHPSRGRIQLAASGRTDALVSAKAAMMTFHTKADLPDGFLEDLNGMSVDGDIVAHSATPVHASFHASFGGTTAREYMYVLPLLPDGAMLSDGEGNTCSYECGEEYAVRIAEAVNVLLSDAVGREIDYVGMMSGKVKTQTTLCTLLDAGCWYYDKGGNLLVAGGGAGGDGGRWNGEDVAPSFGDCWRETRQKWHDNAAVVDDTSDFPGWTGCLVFRVKSDRFLRRMMRKVVNSLLQEATSIVNNDLDGDGTDMKDWKGKWRHRVEAQDRTGNTPAPPQGLCFWRVEVE